MSDIHLNAWQVHLYMYVCTRNVCMYVCMYVCKTLFNHASLGQLYTAGFHEGRHTNTKRYIKQNLILFTNVNIIYRK